MQRRKNAGHAFMNLLPHDGIAEQTWFKSFTDNLRLSTYVDIDLQVSPKEPHLDLLHVQCIVPEFSSPPTILLDVTMMIDKDSST